MKRLIALLAVCFGLWVLYASINPGVQLPATTINESSAEGVVIRINKTREELGLSSLVKVMELDASAKDKCEHMVEHDYWSHSGGGKDWYEFIDDRVDFHQSGEILAKGYYDVDEQHEGWLSSPTHYDVMTNGDFKAVGVGVCDFGVEQALTVVHFVY